MFPQAHENWRILRFREPGFKDLKVKAYRWLYSGNAFKLRQQEKIHKLVNYLTRVMGKRKVLELDQL